MARRPLPARATAERPHGPHRQMPYEATAAGESWPQAPKPGQEPWKDAPGQQPDPDGGPNRGISMRVLLAEAAADLRGGIGADPVFHFIESRLSEIATVLPKAVENSSGDLFQLLRALNEVI